MKVIAYKCVHDGQLFEHKEDYQKHLKVLAARRRKEQREQRKKDAAIRFAMKVRAAKTFDELRCLIIEHFDALHRYKTGRGSFYKYKKSNVIDIGFSLCFCRAGARRAAEPRRRDDISARYGRVFPVNYDACNCCLWHHPK